MTTELRGLLTDEYLLKWAHAYGVELTNRDELLRAAALGITNLLWRNTHLENIHAYGEVGELYELQAKPDEDENEWCERYLDEVSVGVLDVFPDEPAADALRTRALVGLRRRGLPIPNDVMLRANTATAAQVHEILTRTLDDRATNVATLSDEPLDDSMLGMPEYLSEVYELMSKPTREILIGTTMITASELLCDHVPHPDLNATGWEQYDRDVTTKGSKFLFLSDTLGPRTALWYLAISAGLAHSPGLYPLPAWDLGVEAVTMESDSTELRWGLVRHAPWLLTAAEARAVSRDPVLEVAVRGASAAAAVRLGCDPSDPVPFGMVF